MFIKEEIDGKRALLKKLMEAEKLDGIYIKKSSNFAWLTGGMHNLVGLATEVGIAGLLITSGKYYVICNEIEAPRMEKEELICEQGYELKTYPWYDEKEAETVFSLAGKAVGSDCGLPGAADISGKINPLRYSLCPWEVERYKALGKLAAACVEEAAETIRPGDTECAVVGRLLERLWSRGTDSVLPFCAADDRVSLFRHPVTSTSNRLVRIEKRAMISCLIRKHGLIISMTRHVHFGKVPAELQKRYEDNVYVDCTFMANTIVGRPVSDVFKAGLAAYAEKGYPEEYKLHHQGGSIGYLGREYKANHNSKEIVLENQGFAWNPTITGSKSEDTMLATSAGPLILSEPVLFPAKIIKKDGNTFNRAAILEL